MLAIFGNAHIRTVLVLIILVLALTGCGGGGGGGTSNPGDNNPPPSTPETVTLTHSPMDLVNVDYIVPMGNMNPPGHTFPTDHVYFYFKDRAQTYTVYAPVTGTITWVYRRQLADGPDYRINITLNDRITAYLDHIVLSDSIVAQTSLTGAGSETVAIPITAGQVLGTTSGKGNALWAMDLGIMNDDVTLSFINPANYPEQTRHAESPLKYYTGDLSTQLYALVRREGADKDGKIDFDVSGRLVGNWFLTGATQNQYNKQLAFVYDVFKPTEVRVSIGGSLSFNGLYAIQANGTNPASVSQASGKVVYQLYNIDHVTGERSTMRGSMMVQLTGPDTLKVQAFDGVANPVDFTSSALTYTR